jgi:sec-independent protein translocase protein TatA
MFSDHWVYLIILLLIALVVFGPKRLPELGQSLGKAINEFRSATQTGAHEAVQVTTLNQSPAPTAGPTTATPAATPAADVAAEPGPSELAG